MEGRITALATAADKGDSAAFCQLAVQLGLPVHHIPQSALAATVTPTDSPVVRRARQTGSVAEAAALNAAGSGARLLCPRMISRDRMASCAIACAPDKEPNQ